MSNPAPPVCTSCGAVDRFELDVRSGTLACTRCGTVSHESSTASFEFLARVDDEDEFANGRTYVSDKATAWGGGTAASGIRGLGGRASQWAAGVGERTAMFHAKKKKEAEQQIRSLCNRFDAISQFRHITHLFEMMKKKVEFNWGYRAGVFAAACVYVGIRQQEREIWIQDLMDCCDTIKEPIHLARAIRLVKLEFEIRTKDIDPLLFVERTLVHLQKVFRSPSPAFHIGNKMKPFNRKNRSWIEGLSLEEARTLAISLLRFSKELYLSHGRAPEQVACAVVLVALEGIARVPCPKQQEFDEEMAWLTQTAAFTIQERYREYSKALTSYAPKLPWVASKAQTWKKKEVVANTKDIVQFWKAVDLREKKKERANVPKEEKLSRAERQEGQERFALDALRTQGRVAGAAEAASANSVSDANTQPGVVEENEKLDGDLGFADPLLTEDDVYGFSPGPDSKSVPDRTARHSAHIDNAVKRPGLFIRGATEWNRHRAAQDAVTKGLGPSGTGPGGTVPDSSSATSLPPSGYQLYRPNTSDPGTSQGSVSVATLVTYGQNPEATRAQLAPAAPRGDNTKRVDTRLGRLLWERPVHEIEDDELFEAGELDSYIRTEEEASLFRQLPRYLDMSNFLAEREARPQQPKRPRRRVRGQLNAEYLELKQEADSKGVGMNTILKQRLKRERGGDDSDDGEVPVSRGFRPRKRKTKVNAEAKAKLEALLAMDSDEDRDEKADEQWVPAAIDAAGQVVSDLVENGETEMDEGEDYFQEADDGGGDWRKEFTYGEVLSDGYEDE